MTVWGGSDRKPREAQTHRSIDRDLHLPRSWSRRHERHAVAPGAQPVGKLTNRRHAAREGQARDDKGNSHEMTLTSGGSGYAALTPKREDQSTANSSTGPPVEWPPRRPDLLIHSLVQVRVVSR